MRRYSQRQNLSTLSEINITPLLDLAFVLLIIFMITTPLLESSMNLVIPSTGTKNPPINTSHVQTVSIDRTDTIRFNNQVMDLESLTTQLVQLKQANPDIGHCDSTRSRFARAKTNRSDGRIATRRNHQGRYRYQSRTELNGERAAFAEVRYAEWAFLAKCRPDRAGARRAYRGTDPLECGSEGLIESREHRVVGWRGRCLGRPIGKTGIAITKGATHWD